VAFTNKQRLDLIEQYIREHKYADLHSLAGRFEISLSTARRALNDLEQKGIIRRHHGGASLVGEEGMGSGGYDFITEDDTRSEEKHRIAASVVERISTGMTVMLDGGTTTYAVARMLTNKRVIVITNSLPIAALLNEVSTCETIVTGGTVYNRLGVLYGPLCESSLRGMHADLAIMGMAGVTTEGIWNSNAMIASFQRRMMAAADETLFIADHSKLNRRSLTLTTPFTPNITLVSDQRPPADIREAIHEAKAKFLHAIP